MKTLAQIQNIDDLDSRVINAAALLEAELRSMSAGAVQGRGLGALVQQQACFATDGFIRDVKLALRIRNRIAHFSNNVEPSAGEKTRAAQHLMRAVKLVRHESGTDADVHAKRNPSRNAERDVNADVTRSQDAERFDRAATQAALDAIHGVRTPFARYVAVAILLASAVLCVLADDDFQARIILGGGAVAGGIAFFRGRGKNSVRKPLVRSQYYCLPGSRCANGDHRCIYCGNRATDGGAIYRHWPYASHAASHNCTKCGKQLFLA